MNLTQLNLKKGITRLWIAAALLWVIVTGLVFHTAIKMIISPTFMPLVYLYEEDKKNFTKFENFLDQYDEKYLDDYNKLIIENNITIYFKKNIPEEQLKAFSGFKSFVVQSIEARAQEISELRSNFLHSVLPFIIFPPIIILVIGFVLRWIVLGFLD